MHREFAQLVLGEVASSRRPGEALATWRGVFGVDAGRLAPAAGLDPGRLQRIESGEVEPSLTELRAIVSALLEHDASTGDDTLRRYGRARADDPILLLEEFTRPLPMLRLLEAIGAEQVGGPGPTGDLDGVTLLDSVKAILHFEPLDYLRIHGASRRRALVFTEVHYGRSPMVAIRTHPIKPALVVFHRPGHVDDLAGRLAGVEGIPLATTTLALPDVRTRLLRLVEQRR